MKFEDIATNWEEDSQLDKSELGDEALKIPKLHHKYYMILLQERSVLKKLESEFKVLKLEKYEFYTQGHTEETKEKGWILPPKGMILKTEIPMYLESDKDIITMSLRIGAQQEKVEFVDSIIKTINTRGYLIKTALDWQKFILGG
jgi:hypothetical protein